MLILVVLYFYHQTEYEIQSKKLDFSSIHITYNAAMQWYL